MSFRRSAAVLLAGLALVQPPIPAEAQAAAEGNKIPKAVMNGLKARFPDAVIQKWEKETEHGVVLYDIEFTQQGRNFEADVRPNGTIDNWERQIDDQDLPGAVRTAVNNRYPGATLGEIMMVTTVRAGKDRLEGYEVNLRTADKTHVEMTVAPGGKILEDSGKKG